MIYLSLHDRPFVCWYMMYQEKRKGEWDEETDKDIEKNTKWECVYFVKGYCKSSNF